MRHDDYRAVLSKNVKALLAKKGLSADTLKAAYVDGPKKGKTVSSRSLRNVLNTTGSAPGIDIIAAIAAHFGLLPWQLLSPSFDVDDLPKLALTTGERKLMQQFEDLRRKFGPPNDPAPAP